MMRAFAVGDVRRIETEAMAALPAGALMAQAAAGLSSIIVDLLGGAYGNRVVLLIGSGDNGGDALLAGALLARRGAQVTALTVSPTEHAHVATLRAAGGRIVAVLDGWESAPPSAVRAMERADLVVDGIVGIGGSGGLRPAASSVVAAIPPDAVVVAVDLPSGIDADTGVVEGDAVHADVTVTMGVYKPGLLIDPAAAYAGAVVLVPLPVDVTGTVPVVEALDETDVEHVRPERSRGADKYAGGVVGIVAGSDRYPGAAVLAVAGGVHGGSGYTRFVGTADVVEAVRTAFPEVVSGVRAPGTPWSDALVEAGRVQAWVVGPGLGTDDDAADGVAAVLAMDAPVLVDADALTVVAERLAVRALLTGREAPTVLTPHAGELARLLSAVRAREVKRSEVEASRLAHVQEAAKALDAVVLLKGSTTLVASPEPGVPVRVNVTGGPWLASAGTGDVLSGLIGTLLASGLEPRAAASVGAYLHGEAGRSAAEFTDGHPRASEVAHALDASSSSDATSDTRIVSGTQTAVAHTTPPHPQP